MDMAECRCAPCSCFRGSRSKVGPKSSAHSSEKQVHQSESSTKVELEREGSHTSREGVGQSQWTIPGVFQSIFHVSADNKLAIKLYGNKKGLLRQKKDHETSNKWMIHPYSHFRYVHVALEC